MPEIAGVKQRGWMLLAALVVAVIALRGWILLYDHSLNSIDGAMQTWFALDNFADGAKLGEAFQSYLGITMILSLLPIFMAFGETLWASTFAAYAMVIVGSFAGAYGIIWMLRPVPKALRWALTILVIFLFYYAGGAAAGLIQYRWPATFDPGVSLRPLRGALPFFVLPVFVWAVRAMIRGSNWAPAVWLGLAAGVALLWSNDAGIPLLIAALMGLFSALHDQMALLAKAMVAFAVGAAAAVFAILMLVTHGDPSGWLQYNFVDVAGDQFWYFGPWGEEARVLSILDLPRIFYAGEPLTALSLMILTASVLFAIWKRLRGRGSPVRLGAFVFVGAALIGTATLPQIGGHIGSEYKAITFVFGLCAPVILLQGRLLLLSKHLLRRGNRKIVPVTAGLAALAMIGMDASTLVSVKSQSQATVYIDEIGFYVTPAKAEDLKAIKRFSSYLDARAVPEDERLLSVYTSTLDIAAGTKSPASVGSLIHALGPDNRASFNKLLFGEAIAVSTIAPDYTGWEGWNTRANWPFFKTLRELYDPFARSDQNILWVRRGGGLVKNAANCEVIHQTLDRFEVVVTSDVSGLASLYIEREAFDAEPRTALLTVTENSPFTRSVNEAQWSDFPRYGIANAEVVEVPAPVTEGEETRLSFKVLDGSPIGFAQCDAQVLPTIDFAALPSFQEGVDRLIARWQ